MKSFEIELVLTGNSSARILSELSRSGLNTREMTACDDCVKLCVSLWQFGAVRRFAKKTGYSVTVTNSGALAKQLRNVGRRSGLLIGAAVCTVFVLFAKDRVLSIEVLTDNESIRSDVLRLLAENGCSAGSYIPDLDKAELERTLKQRTEGVSWAGITITDSTLIVDVYENEPQPDMFYDRMPSDLVAVRDAVVERVEVLDGKLVTTVGSGVVKGDKLVSGRIPVVKKVVKEDESLGRILVEEQSEKYVRSLGSIYGSFDDVVSFTQPLSETSLVHSGKTSVLKKLRVFSTDIPLYIKCPQGCTTVSEDYSPITFLGVELPVGIKTEECEPITFSTVIYTKEQAAERLQDMKAVYEQNFLSECEIRSAETEFEYTEESVKLTVTYHLYGVISEEKQFFIKK